MLNLVLIIAFTIIFVIVTAIYIHYKKTYYYWSNRGINGPKPFPIYGNIPLSLSQLPLAQNDWVYKYGKIHGHYFFSDPMLTIADVDLLKDILIRNFHKFSDQNFRDAHPLEVEYLFRVNGDQWRLDRSIMSPAFSSGKMKAMFNLMQDAYKNLDREFEKLAKSGEEFDCKVSFGKLTLMIIARCAFAREVDAFEDPNNEILVQLHKAFDADFWSYLKILILSASPEFVRKWFELSLVNKSVLEYLYKLCNEILKQRINDPSSSNDYPDLLQLLVDARFESESNGVKVAHGLTDRKIISNLILFFIAGYETTSNVLLWASYTLAMNPDCQEKLYQEVKEASESNTELNYDFFHNLKYLDAFIDETLRMYTPAIGVSRKCIESHVLPNGLSIEKGTTIYVPIHYIHHNPENYVDPEKFDPERFLPENKSKIDQCAFLPFIQGPRNCIGMRFALLEIKMTLAKLILKFKFLKSQNTPTKLVFEQKTQLLTVAEMPIKLEKRK